MNYIVSADYGHGRDYVCVVIAEQKRDHFLVIGEGWHLSSQELALEIAISTIKPWWKRWLFRLRQHPARKREAK